MRGDELGPAYAGEKLVRVPITARVAFFLLMGMDCAAVLPAAAPVKLNGTLVTNGDVYHIASAFQFSPDGSHVLYLADQETDDLYELYIVPSGGGTPLKLNNSLVNGGDVGHGLLQFSPDGSRVLYRADQDQDETFEIYSVPTVGGTPVKLNGPMAWGGDVFDYYGARFSPDGTHVVYNADQEVDDRYELYSVPSNGGTPTKLNGTLVPGGDAGGFWSISPDGANVLYVADQDTDGVNELYIVPTTGGTPTKLNGPLPFGGNVSYVNTFSPDGSRVLYRADQNQNDTFEIYSVPSAGGTPVKLNGPLVASGDADFIGFSPDGSLVLYLADQEVDEVEELFTVPSTGGTPTKLNGTLPFSGDVSGGMQFSPDGSRVLYRADQNTDEVYEIFSVPSTGGTPTKLNGTLVNGGDVVVAGLQISPDSERVLYRADQDVDEVFEIYSVPIAGCTPVKLNGTLPSGGDVSEVGLQFSPDGSRVLYHANQVTNTVFEIYIVPSAGGTPVKVNATLPNGGDVSEIGLQFSPDGSRILYRADQDTNDVMELYTRVVRLEWDSGPGDWDTAANWDQNVAPDEAMQVAIDVPALVTLSDEAINATVNELRVGGVSEATLHLADDATLTAINGVTIDSGGTIQGNGGIVGFVHVLPGGRVSPGSSQGALEVGDFSMYADSMLDIEIGGTTGGADYDRLWINNAATLGGELNVALVENFMPEAMHTFAILISSELEGSFSNVASGARLDTLGGEGSFLVSYDGTTNAVVLSDFMASAGLAGDFNGDGSVDAADYAAWRDGLGTLYSEADYDVWREHFGDTLGSGAGEAASAAVPEPAAVLLFVTGILVCPLLRGRGQ